MVSKSASYGKVEAYSSCNNRSGTSQHFVTLLPNAYPLVDPQRYFGDLHHSLTDRQRISDVLPARASVLPASLSDLHPFANDMQPTFSHLHSIWGICKLVDTICNPPRASDTVPDAQGMPSGDKNKVQNGKSTASGAKYTLQKAGNGLPDVKNVLQIVRATL